MGLLLCAGDHGGLCGKGDRGVLPKRNNYFGGQDGLGGLVGLVGLGGLGVQSGRDGQDGQGGLDCQLVGVVRIVGVV